MGFLDATGITTLVRRLKTKFALKSGDTFTGDISIETSGGASISLLDSDGYSTTIIPSAGWVSGNKTINLPPYSGTLATTSQIPTLPTQEAVALSATDTSVATIGGLRLYEYGAVRVLMGYITAVNMTTTLTTVTTIPAGHRPVAGTPLSFYSTVTALATAVGIVNAGGTVQIRLPSARTSGNIYIHAAWIVSA